MNISYDYYRVFYYVAKYKSFTGAAGALLNNQPNITRMIKKLEEEQRRLMEEIEEMNGGRKRSSSSFGRTEGRRA